MCDKHVQLHTKFLINRYNNITFIQKKKKYNNITTRDMVDASIKSKCLN